MNGTMAVPVNSPVMLPPQLYNPNVKDSRWLTLEVCREYTRNKCTRSDQECKFAHPPPHVEVQNGRVTCCFDSIKVSGGFSTIACDRVILGDSILVVVVVVVVVAVVVVVMAVVVVTSGSFVVIY